MRGKHSIHSQQGFTLIEIIAVLVLLGILAAVAVPKYMDLTDEARKKAAVGQISEVKGRLAITLANEMIKNNGTKPTKGSDLVSAANTLTPGSCPLTDTTAEGDFNFKCLGNADQTVTITVTKVQGTEVTGVSDTYSFGDVAPAAPTP